LKIYALKNLIRWTIVTAALAGLELPMAHGHAGHDAIPEAAVQVTGDVAPRFYSTSETFDAVLVFPEKNKPEATPLLYLTTKMESNPVTAAQVVAEILTPEPKELQVTAGSTSGTYSITGLNPETTHTISVEITSDQGSDFLTFDNVIVEHRADSENPPELATSSAPFGLPIYIIYALIAAFGIMLLANILAVAIWIMRLVRDKSSSQSRSKSEKSVLPLILISSGLVLIGGNLWAHAGDDHSGANLAQSATLSSGSVHFVSIQTQFQTDIRTTQAVEQMLPQSFDALGQIAIRPDLQADVTPPAEGKLKPPPENNGHIPIAGDEVKKGQTLVILEQLIPASDKVTISADRSQVEAELNQANQELALAAKNAERADKLRNVVSAKEVEEAIAARNIAAQKVSGLRNRLATLTQSLTVGGDESRDIPIVSPISGVIVESHVTQGEYVSPDKVLYEIVNLDEVFVQADIFESDIASVSEASTATITLEAYPGRVFHGMLHSLGQQIDPSQRTLRALFNVPNRNHLLRGGMFVNVAIQSGASSQSITIPKSAIFSQDGIKQVYKKLGPETFLAVPIVVSRYSEDRGIVAAGLTDGDRIAISGLYQIRMSPVVSGGN